MVYTFWNSNEFRWSNSSFFSSLNLFAFNSDGLLFKKWAVLFLQLALYLNLREQIRPNTEENEGDNDKNSGIGNEAEMGCIYEECAERVDAI